MSADEGFAVIFASLCDKHGVRGNPASMAIVRAAAKLLNRDDMSPQDASAAAALLAQLPTPPEGGDVAEPEPDWDRLSPRQAALFDRLYAIALGQVPARRPRTRVCWAALTAADVIDRIVARGGKPSEGEFREIMNNFVLMISAMGMAPSTFWRPIYEPSSTAVHRPVEEKTHQQSS
jgi:hypothetical protein